MRPITLLMLTTALLSLAACGEDPADPPPEAVPLALEVDRGSHLMLFWQSVIFEDPDAHLSPLGPLTPGTLLPIVDGAVDLAVTPSYTLYQHACAHFGEPCDADLQALEAAANYSLASLLIVDDLEGDGQLDCTLSGFEDCMAEIDPQLSAPGHLLLFAHRAFDAADDHFLARWGVEGRVEAGVWLVDYRGKRDASLHALGDAAIVFDPSMEAPNVF